MTIEREKQLLEEILDSYGLEPIVNGLMVRYSLDEVQTALSGTPCPWEVESDRDLCDSIISACQQPNTPDTGYMHPTEGWVSSNWPS